MGGEAKGESLGGTRTHICLPRSVSLSMRACVRVRVRVRVLESVRVRVCAIHLSLHAYDLDGKLRKKLIKMSKKNIAISSPGRPHTAPRCAMTVLHMERGRRQRVGLP